MIFLYTYVCVQICVTPYYIHYVNLLVKEQDYSNILSLSLFHLPLLYRNFEMLVNWTIKYFIYDF